MGGKKVCAWLLANCEVQLCSALAAISILGVVVMCPMMLDPSIDTLVSSFDEGMCQTVYNQFLRGLSNCTWTSCREGCTAEVYSCYHLVVVYVKGTAEDIDAFHNINHASANQLQQQHHLDQKTIRLEGRQRKELLPRSNKNNVNSHVVDANANVNIVKNQGTTNEDDEISADIIKSILGGADNETTEDDLSSSVSSSPPSITSTTTASPTSIDPKKSGEIQYFPEEHDLIAEEEPPVPRTIMPPHHDLQVYEYNNTFIRDLDANLLLMMNQIRQNLEIEGWGRAEEDPSSQANFSLLGIGALLPNLKGCVYPSETLCTEFIHKYGKVGGAVFPCYISKFNKSTVVVTVDKAAAVRHIFYSFIPLVIASGVFTYLFYRVGLIGSNRKRKPGDEEAGSEDNQNPKERNGGLRPPVVKKKLRRKFLPNSNSSKRRRKGKIFNKKSLLSVKQMSIKSPSSSRRTPNSMSIGAISDDGFSGGYNRQTSVHLM